MKRADTSQQMHGRNKADQAKIMVAVHVADENVINALKLDPMASQLHLRAFSTVDEEELVARIQHLRSWISPQGWSG